MNCKQSRANVFLPASMLGIMLLSAGCGGRPANPVDTVQATDATVPCAVLRVEYDSNEARARAIVGEKLTAENQNAALAAVGILLAWPALLAIDVRPTEKTELRALRDRNRHLVNLMTTKNCPQTPKIPTSPVKGPGTSAQSTGAPPECRTVGGYEAYMKKTGKVCRLN